MKIKELLDPRKILVVLDDPAIERLDEATRKRAAPAAIVCPACPPEAKHSRVRKAQHAAP